MSAADRVRCRGRKCGTAIYDGTRAIRYAEDQCSALCASDPGLCGKCLELEDKYMRGANYSKRWHGRVGGPLPNYSHISGSKWNAETRAKENARAGKLVTSLVSDFEKSVAKTEKASEKALASAKKEAEIAAEKAAKAARKAAKTEEHDAKKAAEAAEKAARKALRATQKAARNAEKAAEERAKETRAFERELKHDVKHHMETLGGAANLFSNAVATAKRHSRFREKTKRRSSSARRSEHRKLEKYVRNYVKTHGIVNRPNRTRKQSPRRTSSIKRSEEAAFNPFYGAGVAEGSNPVFHPRRHIEEYNPFYRKDSNSPSSPKPLSHSKAIYRPVSSSSASEDVDLNSLMRDIGGSSYMEEGGGIPGTF